MTFPCFMIVATLRPSSVAQPSGVSTSFPKAVIGFGMIGH